jgi:hypothetical protein
VDIALGEEQVVRRIGVDVGDAALVADDADLALERGDVERSRRLGHRPPRDRRDEADGREADHDEEHDDEAQQPSDDPQSPSWSPPA